MTKEQEVAAIDSKSLLDPGPPLEHADRLLRDADPGTASIWARTAVRLMRLALERATDRHWHQARPELMDCSTTMRMLMLETSLGRAAARDAFVLWSRLSDATHLHPYELAPTAAELRRFHCEVAQLVGQLDGVDGQSLDGAE